MSLGMGAEWPGDRDSGPELARGWAGSWIVRICTCLATKIFQDFSRIFLLEDQPLLAPLQLPLVGDAEVA